MRRIAGSLLILLSISINAHTQQSHNKNIKIESINGFQFWSLGKDNQTNILPPAETHDINGAKRYENNFLIAHGKFLISGWGELYTPLLQEHKATEQPVNIKNSKWVTIEYASNRKVVLQLRHAYVHGGIHNHYELPNTHQKYHTIKIPFSQFKGGLQPLDLARVSKFNFAMIGKNNLADFSEIKVKSIIIDNFTPVTATIAHHE